MKILLPLFLAFLLSVRTYAQIADSILMEVGKEKVSVVDFLYAYQKNGMDAKETMAQFLEDYRNRKLKVAYAEKLGLDTLRGVRLQLDYFRKMMEVANDGVTGGLHGPSLYVGHLLLPLPQHASASYRYEQKTRMDSIYGQIKERGNDFMTVVNAVSQNTSGNAFWISKAHVLQEMENQAYSLGEGEMSRPFLDYDGYHLLKVLNKVDFSKGVLNQENSIASVARHREVNTHLLEDYRDGLLLLELQKTRTDGRDITEESLKDFFNTNKKKYEWNVPHFKGAVFFCKDKKAFKKVKKILKKTPMSEWDSITCKDAIVKPLQLYKLSQNAYVDELVFGGPKPQTSISGYPFYGVLGKKMKKGPEDYTDIRNQVLADYQKGMELLWLDEIRKEIPVQVNMAVFKRIYNNKHIIEN